MKTRYSRQGLWTLFLMCTVLLHMWALILIARDMSWVAVRTNVWDAVGAAAYGLVFTLIESFLLFILAALLGFFTPRVWTVERRVAFLSILVWIAALWSAVSQLYFLLGASVPAGLLKLLARTSHPLRTLYLLAALLVVPSVLVPAGWMTRSERALKIWHEISDRFSLLAGFYLLIDAFAMIVMVIRNMG